LKNIISQNVSPSRCPFFYLVAVHHLCHYIFDVTLVGVCIFEAMLGEMFILFGHHEHAS